MGIVLQITRGLRAGPALDAEGASRLAELVAHARQVGLEPPALDVREAEVASGGQFEGGQVGERRADSLEALGEPCRQRAEPRRLRGRPHGGQRRHEERAPRLLALGVAVGLDERVRLAGGQPVALGRDHERLLRRALDAAQRSSERGSDRARVHAGRDAGRQAGGEEQARGDPARALAEEPGDPGRTELVLGPERMDGAGLVERREGAAGRVGDERQGPGLGA
jgi:hypothetical protein